MNISKNKGLFLVVALILLAIFNMIAFLLPFNRSEMFWTGYGFSMAGILLAIGVSAFTFRREGLKSKVYGWPLLTLVWRYLILQLIIGLLEMILSSMPFQYGIVLNSILLGLCLIGLAAADIGKGEVERIDERIKEKVFYLQSLQADIEGMAGKSADENTQEALNGLAEVIRYSDPMSSPQLATIENQIKGKIEVLSDAVEISDSTEIKSICNEVQQLFAERNRKCKILK